MVYAHLLLSSQLSSSGCIWRLRGLREAQVPMSSEFAPLRMTMHQHLCPSAQ